MRKVSFGILLAVVVLTGILASYRSPTVRGAIREALAHYNAVGAGSRAFYFWKVQWAPTAQELTVLGDLQITRLYLRFFDVEWDAGLNWPSPVAPIQMRAGVPPHISTIPVVYIKNQVFQNILNQNVERLVDQVWGKVSTIASENHLSIQELQIDCDWTETTRARYFWFLEAMKRKAHDHSMTLSSTIRLHQVKYLSRTGRPPVDRGMLMFYNMGQLGAGTRRSSIYNSVDAKKYTSHLKAYPMELDVVLPIFSWVVHSRDGQVRGLIEKTESSEFEQNSGFTRLAPGQYQAIQSFFMHGTYFKRGDILNLEQISPSTTREAAALAAKSLRHGHFVNTVAFFDLDERNTKIYETSEFKKIFGYFN